MADYWLLNILIGQAILILTFFWNCFASFGPLDSLTSLCLDFEGKSIGCNLPPDLIQIAQYLKMFSIHSCHPWICSQNFHSQPYLYEQGIISFFMLRISFLDCIQILTSKFSLKTQAFKSEIVWCNLECCEILLKTKWQWGWSCLYQLQNSLWWKTVVCII